jgi:hypothetical protein
MHPQLSSSSLTTHQDGERSITFYCFFQQYLFFITLILLKQRDLVENTEGMECGLLLLKKKVITKQASSYKLQATSYRLWASAGTRIIFIRHLSPRPLEKKE